jgi:hypothetical protein
MDDAIRGISSVHGPRSIGQSGRGSQRRGKGFEEAMKGKDPQGAAPDREGVAPGPQGAAPDRGGLAPDPRGAAPDRDDAPGSAVQSGLDPVPKGLQDHRPPGRRGDEGRRQIDVLA